MTALITGASSGIGREFAYILNNMGYDIIAVARRQDRLEELKKELKGDVTVICCDLSVKENCFELYDKVADRDIDIVINNAGFGVYGEFDSTSLEKELGMISVNINAVHMLTKLFVNKFEKVNKGRILNVASSAGFMMGPFLSSYYASKAYVLRLSQAIDRELKQKGSSVRVHTLCPGPVETEFDKMADVKNSMSGLSSQYVAKYAVKKMLKGKSVIIPGFGIRMSVFFSKLIPDRLLSLINYHIQKKKS